MSANLLSAVTSVFDIAGLDPYERVALIYLRSLSAEHGAAFPSYHTIAQKCGMARRTAINVIKRLVDSGLITKEHRYKIVSEERKQTSNSFDVTSQKPDAAASNAPESSEVSPLNAPYKESSFKNSIKQEEEYISPRTSEEFPYIPFENEIKRHKIPSETRTAILECMRASGNDIWHYSAEAIHRALKKALLRIKLGSGLYNPPKWIVSAIRNEQMNLDMINA